jgi:hypothetical protein
VIVKRLSLWFLIAVVGIAALSVSLPFVRVAANVRNRVAASCVRSVALDVLARTLVSTAAAQEVLEFKPVSPESAAKIEGPKPSRRRSVSSVPAVPPVPAPPGEPSAPEPPSPPEPPISIGKSGNIMRVGSDIHIETDQVVVGDVMAVGGDVTVDGHVEGDVVSMGGDVYVHSGGRVDGDVVCMGGELHEDEGAVIGGQRVTASRHGRQTRTHRAVQDEVSHGFVGPMIWLLITLGIAWAFAGLAPGRTGRALDVLKHEPGTSAVTGMLAAMLTVPSIVALCLLVALLCITIIGIPLALGALFGYFAFLGVLWMWGYVVGATAIGDAIVRRRSATAAMGGAPGASTSAWPDTGAGVSAPAMPPVAAASAGLTRAALSGVLVISGAGFLGSLFHRMGLGALGTLLTVLSWLAFSGVTLIGAGAWLRAEFKAGTLSRLWGARRRGASASAAPAASVASETGSAAGVAPPPAEPPVTPAGA